MNANGDAKAVRICISDLLETGRFLINEVKAFVVCEKTVDENKEPGQSSGAPRTHRQ